MNAFEKKYMRQLTPIKDLAYTAAPDSITLTWDKCPDGSKSGATWKVNSYYVYVMNGGDMTKLKDLTPQELTYTIPDLVPITAYTYRVGVEYEVKDPPVDFSGKTRYYAEIKAETAEQPAVSSPPASPSQPELSPSLSASPAPSPLPSDTAVVAETAALPQAVPVWLIIVICAVGALAVYAIVLTVVMRKRKSLNNKTDRLK